MASSSVQYKYDVFLSFRGEDTLHSFTAHLYKALRQAGIRTFRDDNDIHVGEELKPEIERSIRKSRASVIVFSKNYANSSWCLDELWLILKQRKKCSHFVLPVFYDVDPSDVRNQRGSFGIEAKDEAEGSKWTEDNVKRWKAALTKVANLKGMVVSGYETDFIAKIVHEIYSQLGLKLESTPTPLTAIETQAKYINSSLENKNTGFLEDIDQKLSTEGSDKRTQAKYIHNLIKQNHERRINFIEELEKLSFGGSDKRTQANYVHSSIEQNHESNGFREQIEKLYAPLREIQKLKLNYFQGLNAMTPNVSKETL